MPEINPVTKDQLFEKKIAENTGSDYNVGDISDIVPVTKDQALLKEIALNSAGQSGDITELEEKVTANTGAIEAIVNEYGAKNILPNTATSQTINGVTFTVNDDGTVTANGTATADIYLHIKDDIPLDAGKYILNGCPYGGGAFSSFSLYVHSNTSDYNYYDEGEGVEYNHASGTVYVALKIMRNTVVNNTTFYPMIRDARIKDPTYVPYAMTNRELTEKQPKKYAESKTSDSTWGIITTNVPETKHISSPSFGNYLAVPYCSGGMWRVQILDVDPNDGFAKKVTNAGPYPLEFIYWD